MELHSFQDLPTLKDKPPAPAPLPDRKFFKNLAGGLRVVVPPVPKKKESGRELIAGGDIRWKPVDRAAAMLLAKAPQINQPPPKTMSEFAKTQIVREASDAEQTNAIANKIIKTAKSVPGSIEDMAYQAAVARKMLEEVTDNMRSDVVSLMLDFPKQVKQAREWRMTIEREKDMSLKALREFRQFFLEDAHDKEMAKLQDFVRTMERLAVLAKDGTLEKVADVMLKLA